MIHGPCCYEGAMALWVVGGEGVVWENGEGHKSRNDTCPGVVRRPE